MSEPANYLRLKQEVSKLGLGSIAVNVPSFGNPEIATDQHRAIVDTINDCISAEEFESRNQHGTVRKRQARSILVLVATGQRAEAVRRVLSSLLPKHVTMSTLSAPKFNRNVLRKDLVIVLASHALQLFRDDKMAMHHFCKLVFDEAQHASQATHPYSELMREFYGWSSFKMRPQVLSIATADLEQFNTGAVEENLFAEFAVQGSDPVWKYDAKMLEIEDTLARVEEVKHGTLSPRLPQTIREDIPALDVLKGELGDAVVVLYENLFLRRSIFRQDGRQARNHMADSALFDKIRDFAVGRGLTEKVMHLVHVLQCAWAASREDDPMMAIVYADRPVVVVGLLALLRSLNCFRDMNTQVVLGDPSSAKPLNDVPGGPGLDVADGWQGDETDDECLDAFGAGDVNVLVVANDNIQRISRCRRPLAPAPLVIRFDGSNVNLDHDGGGGHCRIIVFKEDASRRKGSADARSQRVKRMKSVADAAVEADSGATQAVKESVQYGDGVNTMNLCKAEKKAPVVGKKRQRSPDPTPTTATKSSSPRNVRRDRISRQEDEDGIAHTVEVAAALVGPQKYGQGDYFLYRFKMPAIQNGPEGTSQKPAASPFMKYFSEHDGEVSSGKAQTTAGGLQDYGVVLSKRLNERDLAISLGELGLQTHVQDDVGSLQLDFVGKISLSSENLRAARKFMMKLFSLLMGVGEQQPIFNWEGYLSRDTCNTPKAKSYYRQYLVVPVRANNQIDWFRVSGNIGRRASEAEMLSKRPAPGENLIRHIDTLQFTLVHVMGRQEVALSGGIRNDQSPLSYFLRSKRFSLNRDGTLKDDCDIRRLIYAVQDADDDEKCAALPCNRENPLRNSQDIKTQQALMRCPQTHSDCFKFSPARNRAKAAKRGDTWVGKFNQTYEEKCIDIHKVHVRYLDQPLITTIQLPRFTMELWISALKGRSTKAIVKEVMESQLIVSTREKVSSELPELCRPHPISAGAMFLPPLLLSLERHVLLCELRDVFASKIKIPMQLKWFAMAVTPSGVNSKNCYERLEFLGDSVLKLSCTLRLFTRHPHASEGNMHSMRANEVSNEALRSRAQKHNLKKFLCFDRAQVEGWTAPGCDRVGKTVVLNHKSLADVTEALCGVLYVSGLEHYNRKQKNSENDDMMLSQLSPAAFVEGYKYGAKMLEVFGILRGTEPSLLETKLAAIHSLHKVGSDAPTKVTKEALPYDTRVSNPQPGKFWKDRYGGLEKTLGYTFHCRHLLICALTHGSFVDQNTTQSTMSETFQRLEFLGDAVLDFCIVAYLYDKYPLLGPGDLTDLKGMIASNESFARVTIEWGFEEFLFMDSVVLKEQIELFRSEMAMNDTNDVDDVGSTAAPKVLGDILESIVGAVLVDKGLERAWNVAMKLLKTTLEEKAVPEKLKEHPTRKLMDWVQHNMGLKNIKPMYRTKAWRAGRFNGRSVAPRMAQQTAATDLFRCTVKLVGEDIATEGATSKVRAELLAARTAFKRLSNPKPNEKDAKLIAKIKIKGNKLAAETLRHCRR